MIQMQIEYVGRQCKKVLCWDEVEYKFRMSLLYGFDIEKDAHYGKRQDGTEFEYFIPKTVTMGRDQDDKNLQIKEIIVTKNVEWSDPV